MDHCENIPPGSNTSRRKLDLKLPPQATWSEGPSNFQDMNEASASEVEGPFGSPNRLKTMTRRRGTSATANITSTTSTAPAATTPTSSMRQLTTSLDGFNEQADERTLDAGMASVRRWIRSRPLSPRVSSSDFWINTSNVSRRIIPPGYVDDSDHENDGEDDIFDLPVQTSYSSENQRNARQRALLEPDGDRIRDQLYQRAISARAVRRRNFIPMSHSDIHNSLESQSPRERGSSVEFVGLTVLPPRITGPDERTTNIPVRRLEGEYNLRDQDGFYWRSMEALAETEEAGSRTVEDDDTSPNNPLLSSRADAGPDPMREARNRWIIINRHFQYVITSVALVFSLLLFAILVCWVILTTSYVISIDKTCDSPLKFYYWFVTLQLILDVFRTDIMRFFFRWDVGSNQRIPCRVILYNVAYLTYALLVLWMGIAIIFLHDGTTCPATAPELFQSAKFFVSLSIAAWTAIIFGYIVPFVVVATLLTLNGYTPSSDSNSEGNGSGPFTVFPAVMGAPSHCIDAMPIVLLEEFPAHYPIECCICMDNFTGADIIVETRCNHVFHKNCCQDWLKQARTCPVCRTDIPVALGLMEGGRDGICVDMGVSPVLSNHGGSSFATRNDIHHEVVSLLQILRQYERQQQAAVVRQTGRRETAD